MKTTNHEIIRAVSFVANSIANLYSSGILPKAEVLAAEFAGKIPHDLYNRILEELKMHIQHYNYKQACAIAEVSGVLSEFWAEYADCEDVDTALNRVLPIKD